MRRAFAIATGMLALGTVVALAVLWPGGGNDDSGIAESLLLDTERAEVTKVEEFVCAGFETQTCKRVTAKLETGPDKGTTTRFTQAAGGLDPDVEVGDEVRLAPSQGALPPGVTPGAQGAPELEDYSLADFERRKPMLLLAILFAALVILFGRLRGALSLVGLGLSLAVILVFVVPAIHDGEEPLLVAVVGSFAVMLVTITLAHGTGPKSLAAILGTGASLLLTVGLAVLFTDLTHLTGFAGEESFFLQASQSDLSLEGLLLAGMVIGALGVLDDVTISQASTVLALRGANPAMGFRELFGRALRVGQDHVSATVNTLVLAYVGASLPVLLIFSSGELPFLDAVNVELVAKEIVATLVGSIGLIAAVPITTALAALVSGELSSEELGELQVGHAH
jgi:uncharacterized membrane protein